MQVNIVDCGLQGSYTIMQMALVLMPFNSSETFNYVLTQLIREQAKWKDDFRLHHVMLYVLTHNSEGGTGRLICSYS